MAVAGWEMGLALAKEKGAAPIMEERFTVTAAMLRKRPEMAADGWKVGQEIPGKVLHAKYSRYMQKIAEVAVEVIACEGMDAATVRNIAARAGYSTTIITHYFNDKDELLLLLHAFS